MTPIVAVLKALHDRQKDLEVRVWSDASFYQRTKEAVAAYDDSIMVQTVLSGKVRRFYGVPMWKQLLQFRVLVIPNILDIFRMIGGIFQSVGRLLVWRPDVVFCKGGFVSVPVGIAARCLGIPVVLHDSDAHPGLANSILSHWASRIGTGATLDHYRYPVDKASYVGIPINPDFHKYSEDDRKKFVKRLGFSTDRPLVVVTGGGLGAKPINDAVVEVLEQLLTAANVLLISGDHQYKELAQALDHLEEDTSIFQLHPFLGDKMVWALAGADVVIARAGATTLLELASLAKPTILIPNPHLAGGHQTKNAAVYAKKNAVLLLDEAELEKRPMALLEAVTSLLASKEKRTKLADAIYAFAMPDAANHMAIIIESTARKGK